MLRQATWAELGIQMRYLFWSNCSTVVCRWLCSAANRNKSADMNWTQREQEITPHASRLIAGVGTETPKFEICNIATAVLLTSNW